MATSTIGLYFIKQLQDVKNYIIEGISNFLPTPIVALTGFQYQRLEASKMIKIDISQTTAEKSARPWNYCAIVNTDAPAAVQYYFIVSYRQRGESTIELSLELDVLNTFYDQFKDHMTEETFIQRTHRDRFILAEETSEYPQQVKYASIFDRVIEGDSPTLWGDNDSQLEIQDARGGDDNEHFYLIYRTDEDGKPCIDFAPQTEILIGLGSTGTGDFVRSSAQILINRYYYLIGDFSITINAIVGGSSVSFTFNTSDGFFRFTKTANGGAEIYYYDSTRAGTASYDSYQATSAAVITRGRVIYYGAAAASSKERVKTFPSYTITAGDYDDEILRSVDALDRTESGIVKVIQCPYCPITYSYDSLTEVYTFSSSFSEKSPEGFLRTHQIGANFGAKRIHYKDFSGYAFGSVYKAALESVTPQLAYVDDPKIYTSPYFQPVFYYDSFSYALKLEDFEFDSTATGNDFEVEVLFLHSNNISSALLFSFDSEDHSKFYMKWSDQNFPHVLTASRNNEIALYSSAYLDYLRNGYNYDKKKLEQNLGFQTGLAALQTLGSIISFALTPVTGGVSAAAGIGLGVGAISSGVKIGQSALQGGEALDQKINQLKKQSYSVSGIDDLSLFDFYGGNKLRYKLYKISDREKDALNTKFRNYGYAYNDYGKPSDFTQSRKFFNYLQCDPVFDEVASSIPGQFLESISDKLRGGVTIWHAASYTHNVSNLILSKDVENWEISLIS